MVPILGATYEQGENNMIGFIVWAVGLVLTLYVGAFTLYLIGCIFGVLFSGLGEAIGCIFEILGRVIYIAYKIVSTILSGASKMLSYMLFAVGYLSAFILHYIGVAIMCIANHLLSLALFAGGLISGVVAAVMYKDRTAYEGEFRTYTAGDLEKEVIEAVDDSVSSMRRKGGL